MYQAELFSTCVILVRRSHKIFLCKNRWNTLFRRFHLRYCDLPTRERVPLLRCWGSLEANLLRDGLLKSTDPSELGFFAFQYCSIKYNGVVYKANAYLWTEARRLALRQLLGYTISFSRLRTLGAYNVPPFSHQKSRQYTTTCCLRRNFFALTHALQTTHACLSAH